MHHRRTVRLKENYDKYTIYTVLLYVSSFVPMVWTRQMTITAKMSKFTQQQKDHNQLVTQTRNIKTDRLTAKLNHKIPQPVSPETILKLLKGKL